MHRFITSSIVLAHTKESGSSLIDHVAYDFATGTLRIHGWPSFDKWETKRTLILTGAERSIAFDSSTKSASLIHPYVMYRERERLALP